MIFSTNQLALGRPGKKNSLKWRFGGFGVALRGNAIMHTRLKRGFVLEPQKNGHGRAGVGGFESDMRETIPNSLGGATDFFRGRLYARGPRRMALSGQNGDPKDMSPICEETVSVIPGYGADLLTSQLFLRAPRKWSFAV